MISLYRKTLGPGNVTDACASSRGWWRTLIALTTTPLRGEFSYATAETAAPTTRQQQQQQLATNNNDMTCWKVFREGGGGREEERATRMHTLAD